MIVIVMIGGRVSFSWGRFVIVMGSGGCGGRRGSSSRGEWNMAGVKGSMSAGLSRVSADDGVVILVYGCHVISGLDDVLGRVIDLIGSAKPGGFTETEAKITLDLKSFAFWAGFK